MDLKVTHINWLGNIYQKFEAVCQEVDGIVGQDKVKYLENQVHNVGEHMKKLYSGVVHELLPFPTLVGSKDESHSVALTNHIGSLVKPVTDHKDNKRQNEENPINNFIESLWGSNAIDNITNNQQDGGPIKNNFLNQVSDGTCSDSLEVEDSYLTQEEIGDDSRETSGSKKENLHSSIEEIAVDSVAKPMKLVYVEEKEPLEFSIHTESYTGSSCSGCGVSIRRKDNIDVNVEQNSCFIAEENAMNSSTSQILNSPSFDEDESIKVSLFHDLSDVDEDTQGIQAEVSSSASSVSCERPITKTEPVCLESSVTSESLHSKSLGSYFEIESCKKIPRDASWCVSENSMVHVCCDCESTPHVAEQIMESHDGLVFFGHYQLMESNDESLVSSIESSLEDIQLNDDPKLGESCVFVDDSELYAVSCRAQKHRSYKKRIQDAFASKKRLAKEYERLAIWYGDANIEPSQGFSQTLLPFTPRTNVNSKNLQVQHASETEWELL